jgi:hypothetical protein
MVLGLMVQVLLRIVTGSKMEITSQHVIPTQFLWFGLEMVLKEVMDLTFPTLLIALVKLRPSFLNQLSQTVKI